MAVTEEDPAIIPCDDLDAAIEQYKASGYRLDMIFPADAPREALVSKLGEQLRLRVEKRCVSETPKPLHGREGSWIKGRAGMEYRDLIPDRFGGKLIASHIRLTEGGEVADYVHYHSIDFQMIYCKLGRIRVVYEDQGRPFWLETGDCILQPQGIRHRVLECAAGAEVIEVSMPAEHETWVDHEVMLPTGKTEPDRDFEGQRFVHHRATDDECRDTGISSATGGLADVRIKRENGQDTKLLLTLRGFGAKGNSLLTAPVTLEIAI